LENATNTIERIRDRWIRTEREREREREGERERERERKRERERERERKRKTRSLKGIKRVNIESIKS